ncbi:MAG: YifB family Mg chelatase-like AAA ATPase [Hespellia sp.]|nr:YifB family Mg chelatase-like AAA ATPase [Hespellia sp.]
MVCTVLSATIDGLKVEFVRVEADVSNGLPMLHMVGYLSAEVKDAAERVRTAIANTGIHMPPKRIVVNLSPATVKKRGASFDLPMAVAILASMGYVEEEALHNVLLIGELNLEGKVLKVPGILPIVLESKARGCQTCIIPCGNEPEGMAVKEIDIIGVSNLQEVLEYLMNPDAFRGKQTRKAERNIHADRSSHKLDFREVQGQELLKRAAEVAVAGQHNMLLIGTPGSSKTMIAKRIPSILPPLTEEESIEISKIYSIMGLLKEHQPMMKIRPFRQVHHTATKTALVGGGAVPRPGEISLAHGGVLMMDELAEYPRAVLESLRQPLEEHEIQIVRARGTYIFPAEFFLVAAMNPCPCGYYPDMEKCRCTQSEINHYLGKISQPFLSRIDICAEAPRVEYQDLKNKSKNESSEEIRNRVCMARERQKARYAGCGFLTNSRIPASEMERYCALKPEAEQMMKLAYEKMNLTARTYHKVLRVARTIADLEGKEQIEQIHLSEALSYRMMSNKYWEREA